MDSKQLQYFLTLNGCGSFRLAAEQCGVSQPGLSKQIMALESELGGPLFNRTGRRATLTPLGECFLPYARRAHRDLEQAREAIGELLRPDRGEICIAGLHSVNTYLLPSILAVFRERYPDTQLRLTSLGSERITKVLLDRLVDMAVLMGPIHSPELVSTPLYEEELVALLPGRHPLARRARVRLQEVAAYPQVVFREGYAMRTALIQHFRAIGVSIEVAVELNTLEAFKEMVRQGVGVAILPLCAVQNLNSDLAIARIEEPRLSRTVELVCRKDNYQVPVVAAFRQLVAEHLPAAFERWVRAGAESWLAERSALAG
ncbi:LysR family transcriptional regulator [Gloeobacter kilaueensis]|uniref:LysR family transcriptional regulator n=1 Tax=Gloeobacter kilaueensis (strain ATCC BAA-2537 / CCAP 1431/1 / ULC 316 / JS1) TaxID=1183438 RepID=U5QCC4_GLOK1|nr:LysR family transcriptional regulator [Gloeobacter kilaueensis]AGY56567.1 LysR family transcriptional regulator [Gloeobacter kilaueensis JS1]